MSRSFHNTTSHYNVYFNGYESYKRGIRRTEKDYQDNFSRLLPIFYFSDPLVAQSVSSDMQRALEKATKVITLHSITAKPELKKGPQTEKQKEFYSKKEYNRWFDDNYLLMGKAYTYKNDFALAIESLKKLITDFPDEETSIEGMIWLARNYNEQGEYREAEKLLNNLSNSEDFPRNLKEKLYTTYADYYLKQGQYTGAIENLERALKHTRKKHYRIRYTYILAQLYQEVNNSEKAISAYRKVIKMNPPYEMTFNAKINMASSFRAGSGKGREFRNLLEKMLRDDKNLEYQDQIYYALGNIALKENKEQQAIDYYKLSATRSVNNVNQKGLSYLSIADIYYSKPDYSLAQAYYDSSMQNIDQQYDAYDELSRKTTSLNHLVEHLNVFVLEDSLQNLASMSENERFKVIDKIIEEVTKKEEEERKRQQEQMQDMQYGMQMGNINRANNTTTEGGKWYFYNMNAKSFGQPEFRMKWGNRKLEDNWRRKNKQSLDFIPTSETDEEADSSTTETVKILSNKSREFYLKDIPLSDSALEQSHTRLEKALYNMGLVYQNELLDYQEAIKSYKEGLERYPGGEYGVLSAYNLYDYYNRRNIEDSAMYYRNYIIRNYPDNPRAKILTNPDFVRQLEEEQNRANVLYEETYNAYRAGSYNRVITNSEYAFSQFRGDPTLPKFKLLRALSIGKLEGNDRLTDELQAVIDQFPDNEVSKFAAEVIETVYNMSPEIAVTDTQEAAEEIYSFEEDAVYYFGVSTSRTPDFNQLNFNLINFNLDHFNRQNLGLVTEQIGSGNVIFVRSFEDLETAMRYYNTYQSNRDAVFKDLDPESVTAFIISENNYYRLKEDTELRKYYLYFRKYYQP